MDSTQPNTPSLWNLLRSTPGTEWVETVGRTYNLPRDQVDIRIQECLLAHAPLLAMATDGSLTLEGRTITYQPNDQELFSLAFEVASEKLTQLIHEKPVFEWKETYDQDPDAFVRVLVSFLKRPDTTPDLTEKAYQFIIESEPKGSNLGLLLNIPSLFGFILTHGIDVNSHEYLSSFNEEYERSASSYISRIHEGSSPHGIGDPCLDGKCYFKTIYLPLLESGDSSMMDGVKSAFGRLTHWTRESMCLTLKILSHHGLLDAEGRLTRTPSAPLYEHLRDHPLFSKLFSDLALSGEERRKAFFYDYPYEIGVHPFEMTLGRSSAEMLIETAPEGYERLQQVRAFEFLCAYETLTPNQVDLFLSSPGGLLLMETEEGPVLSALYKRGSYEVLSALIKGALRKPEYAPVISRFFLSLNGPIQSNDLQTSALMWLETLPFSTVVEEVAFLEGKGLITALSRKTSLCQLMQIPERTLHQEAILQTFIRHFDKLFRNQTSGTLQWLYRDHPPAMVIDILNSCGEVDRDYLFSELKLRDTRRNIEIQLRLAKHLGIIQIDKEGKVQVTDDAFVQNHKTFRSAVECLSRPPFEFLQKNRETYWNLFSDVFGIHPLHLVRTLSHNQRRELGAKLQTYVAEFLENPDELKEWMTLLDLRPDSCLALSGDCLLHHFAKRRQVPLLRQLTSYGDVNGSVYDEEHRTPFYYLIPRTRAFNHLEIQQLSECIDLFVEQGWVDPSKPIDRNDPGLTPALQFILGELSETRLAQSRTHRIPSNYLPIFSRLLSLSGDLQAPVSYAGIDAVNLLDYMNTLIYRLLDRGYQSQDNHFADYFYRVFLSAVQMGANPYQGTSARGFTPMQELCFLCGVVKRSVCDYESLDRLDTIPEGVRAANPLRTTDELTPEAIDEFERVLSPYAYSVHRLFYDSQIRVQEIAHLPNYASYLNNLDLHVILSRPERREPFLRIIHTVDPDILIAYAPLLAHCLDDETALKILRQLPPEKRSSFIAALAFRGTALKGRLIEMGRENVHELRDAIIDQAQKDEYQTQGKSALQVLESVFQLSQLKLRIIEAKGVLDLLPDSEEKTALQEQLTRTSSPVARMEQNQTEEQMPLATQAVKEMLQQLDQPPTIPFSSKTIFGTLIPHQEVDSPDQLHQLFREVEQLFRKFSSLYQRGTKQGPTRSPVGSPVPSPKRRRVETPVYDMLNVCRVMITSALEASSRKKQNGLEQELEQFRDADIYSILGQLFPTERNPNDAFKATFGANDPYSAGLEEGSDLLKIGAGPEPLLLFKYGTDKELAEEVAKKQALLARHLAEHPTSSLKGEIESLQKRLTSLPQNEPGMIQLQKDLQISLIKIYILNK